MESSQINEIDPKMLSEKVEMQKTCFAATLLVLEGVHT